MGKYPGTVPYAVVLLFPVYVLALWTAVLYYCGTYQQSRIIEALLVIVFDVGYLVYLRSSTRRRTVPHNANGRTGG